MQWTDRRLLIHIYIILLLFTNCSSSYAAAFQFYELGTPIIGTAAVGQAAYPRDASVAYFNPAAMSFLPKTEFLVGTALITPHIQFKPNHFNTISGNNGGAAGLLVAFPGFYLTQFITPKLRFGVSLNAPYGGYLNYNDGWVGRYKVQYTQLTVVDLNPVISYRIHERVSLGGGVVVEYANLRETIALPLPFPFDDGQINLKVQNYSAGYNLGALILLNRTARLGISYRSKINHDLKGKLTFLRVPFSPGITTNVTMPQNLIVSIVDDIHPCISLLGELGWANWSVMKNTTVNVAGFTGEIPLNWRNTYRLGIGGAYHANHFVTIQSGISYDSSPTNTKRRLPNLPMDKQIRVGAGMMFTNGKGAQIGFSYEYINFGRARINNVGRVGILSGDYSTNYANVVQASINVAL